MDIILSFSYNLIDSLDNKSELVEVTEKQLTSFSQISVIKEQGDNILLAVVNVFKLAQSGWNLCKDIYEDINLDIPVLAVVGGDLTSDIIKHTDYFEDFVLINTSADELEIRITKMLKKSGKQISKTLITYGPITINTDTYQVLCDNRTLDLAYMEYELLKFLVSKPGKVFSRQALLSRVWGYEYYGGARTVDVHIRRLRAKLGEEHANLVQTVRSVGYRFGLSKF
jgi:DNA-binding response OmpR family regulator